MKIHPELNLIQAIYMVKHPSVHAKVNIACDREAEIGRTIFQGKQTINPTIPNKVGVVLEVEGKQVFRNMKEQIFHVSHAPELLGYLEKFEWGESIYNIDWESHKNPIRLSPGWRFTVDNVLLNWL